HRHAPDRLPQRSRRRQLVWSIAMTASLIMQATNVLPLVPAAVIALTVSRPNLREGLSFVAGLLVLLGLHALHGAQGAGAEVQAFWLELMPGLAIAFRLEALGLMFALIAGLLWPVAILYAVGYMRAHREPQQTRFYACFALAIGAVM